MFYYFNELLGELSTNEVMVFSFIHAIYYRSLNENEVRYFICSNDYIADKLKISQPTISKSLKTLHQLGYIDVLYQPTATGQLRFIVPKLVDLSDIFGTREDTEGGQKYLGGVKSNLYEPPKDVFTSSQKNFIHNNNNLNKKNLNNNREGAVAPVVASNNDTIIKGWNEIANKYGLSPITTITPTRMSHFKQRCAEAGGQEMFFKIVENAVKASEFLRGKNNKRWKAGFDFFLQQSSFVKSAEGTYSRRTGVSPVVSAVTGQETKADDLFSEFTFSKGESE